MFRFLAKVWVTLGSASAPGICVADPTPAVFTNRQGATIRTETVPIISLRTPPGRPSYYRLSYESGSMLSLRDTVEPGLDVDDAGNPVPLPALWAKQHESLTAFLAQRQQPEPAQKVRPAGAKA